MPYVVQIEGKLQWVYAVHRETGHFVGICEPLKLTVNADNPQEFHESIREGMDSFFRELLSTGDLHKFLRDQGWRAITPIPERRRGVYFDVPLNTRRVPERDLQEAVC
jgi:hypothetical protein